MGANGKQISADCTANRIMSTVTILKQEVINIIFKVLDFSSAGVSYCPVCSMHIDKHKYNALILT